MATRKLYHEDSALLETQSALVRQEEAGGRWAVVVECTVVFPGGGGQPADRGWIADQEITGVSEEGEEIVHLVASPLEGVSPGSMLRVRVDPRRRRESAQQHTGQHIVSACLLRVGGVQTVSVHMGEDTMTVESPVQAIPEQTLRAVEECANEIVCRNLPVRSHLVGGEELGRFNLRRAAAGRELYRIVEIEGHDASACGGVHVGRTGEVGLVKCMGWEKIRGNCRTIWLVGDRAYRDYARTTQLLSALTAELSAPQADLLDSARKLKAEVAALRELVERHDLEAAAREAERIVTEAPRPGGVIVRRLEGASRAFFRALGTELSRRPGVTALLANAEAGSAQLLACRGPDVVLELGAALKPHLSVVNGKGGGREGMWQGVAQNPARLDEFLERAGGALDEARGAS